jgi:hypothetical protein
VLSKVIHYIIQILAPLSDWRATQVGSMSRKLIVHTNNTHCHTRRITFDFLSITTIGRTPHASYSSDVILYDFYLFGYVNESPAGKEFTDWEEFLEAVNRILESVGKVMLE